MTPRIGMRAIDPAGGRRVRGVRPDVAGPDKRGLSRTRLATRPAEQPACVVAMEARAPSHRRARVARRHGHAARPGRPCEAGRATPAWGGEEDAPAPRFPAGRSRGCGHLAEAAPRPGMRVVAVKSAGTWGRVSSIGLEPMVRWRTPRRDAAMPGPAPHSADRRASRPGHAAVLPEACPVPPGARLRRDGDVRPGSGSRRGRGRRA